MNKEDLSRFIDFTKSLLLNLKDKNEYSWFFDSFRTEIVNNFFLNYCKNQIENNKLKNITDSDISRIKAYLIFIDKKAMNNGKIFYGNLSNRDLKTELIKDFREMQIALKNDNVIEFGRRLSLQLENIFNYSLNELNVHKLIASDPKAYESVIRESSYNKKPFNFYLSFFKTDKISRRVEPIELSKISFSTKSIFLAYHFNYVINVKNITDIYFLRNKGSHREKLSQEDQQKLDDILLNFDRNYSYYYKLLIDVVNGIKNL